MAVSSAAVVVCFEPVPGIETAAVWDGSRWCEIHVLEDGVFGPVVERWDMWHEWTQAPAIPCTPDALRELVEFRLSDEAAAEEIADTAAGYLAWCERCETASGFAGGYAPEFSEN